MRYASPNISIQLVKRGAARRLANTVLKVVDRTWRGKHQVRTPVHELGYSIAENKGEVKTIRQRRIASVQEAGQMEQLRRATEQIHSIQSFLFR